MSTPSSTPPGTTREFLATLFADAVVPGSELVVFANKRSSWHESLDSAAERIRALDAAHDTYFHVALHNRDAAMEAAIRKAKEQGKPEPSQLAFTRGHFESAVAVGGIWADIDFAGGGHDKSGLPTEAEVRTMIRGLPAPPTILVNTGGGLHGWWLYREVEVLANDDERKAAEAIVAGWQENLRTALKRTLDSTHDLARVLRPLGTHSRKHGGLAIRLELAKEGPRYNPTDFEQYRGLAGGRKVRVPIAAGSFVVDEGASPPFDKLAKLCELDATFRRTWNRKRNDFASGKESQSEYDLALASRLAAVGWSDQEIVDTLIAHRRLGGKDAKRPDYYILTLGKARTKVVAEVNSIWPRPSRTQVP